MRGARAAKTPRVRGWLGALIFALCTAASAYPLLTAVRPEHDCKCGGDPLGWPVLWHHPCGGGEFMAGGLLADLAVAAAIPGTVVGLVFILNRTSRKRD